MPMPTRASPQGRPRTTTTTTSTTSTSNRKPSKRKPSGYTIWRGPSPVNGVPIVAVMVRSTNRKTGKSWQIWILLEDLHPHQAILNGADVAVCGSCPHRYSWRQDGEVVRRVRTCYVQEPVIGTIWRSYKAGKYPTITLDEARSILGNSFLRWGAYGDPGMLPYHLAETLNQGRHPRQGAGYTHQSREPWFDRRWLRHLMVSADSPEEAHAAQQLGARTFRVNTDGLRLPGEVVCPASAEMNHRATCSSCGLCSGTSTTARSVTIRAHGSARRLVALPVVA